jgi:hypothetical protein
MYLVHCLLAVLTRSPGCSSQTRVATYFASGAVLPSPRALDFPRFPEHLIAFLRLLFPCWPPFRIKTNTPPGFALDPRLSVHNNTPLTSSSPLHIRASLRLYQTLTPALHALPFILCYLPSMSTVLPFARSLLLRSVR